MTLDRIGPTSTSDFLTIPEVMRRARIQSRTTVYKLISRGELIAVKLGRSTRITSSSYEALIAGLPAATVR